MNQVQDIMPNWLRQRAMLTPDRTAVQCSGNAWTFKELDHLAESTARKLASLGLREGGVCALLIRNHMESVKIIHGLFYLGVKIILLNNRLTPRELSWQMEDSGASVLISDPLFKEKAENAGMALPGVQTMMLDQLQQLEEDPGARILSEFSLSSTATVMYTSGTTGHPKGVLQTFGNHWWSAAGSALNLGLHEHDCWYCAVPVFHISGFSILMKNVIYGMKVILAEKFIPEEANRAIKEDGVTIMSVVTAMLNRMTAALGQASYPETFRCFLLGGGPAPLRLLEICKENGMPVYQSYGMTETASQIVTLAPEDSLRKLGSAGKPLFPCQLRIESEGRQAEAFEHGEIVVAGPNVTSGYLNREEATVKSIIDGWLYTGDIGYLDDEGFLYVLDRRSDLLISGGENVYPAEIEGVLAKHEAVFEAGVTAMEDDKWGQVPVAFVVAAEGRKAEEAELIEFCRTHLAAYKVPRRIYFCKSLPRNASNKLLRRELKERLTD